LTNGLEIYYWDQQNAAPRLVAGVFSLLDLERLLYQRQNAITLSATLINPQIAGRIYQQEAI